MAPTLCDRERLAKRTEMEIYKAEQWGVNEQKKHAQQQQLQRAVVGKL